MSRVVVTGATGFIGRHLARALRSRGDEVTAIVRPASKQADPPDVTVVRAPLEAHALAPAFSGADVVVHLAGVVQAARESVYHAVNAEGTREVAAAARAAGARLVHVSSLAAAGPAAAEAPHKESDEPRPLTPYGRSKLASERYVAAIDGLSYLILRPGIVYGPTDGALLPLFRLVRGGFMPLLGRQDAAYTFVHIDDCVRALVAAVDDRGPNGILFVGHPNPVTPPRLLDALSAAVGRRPKVIHIADPIAWAVAGACDAAGYAIGRSLPLNRWRFAEMQAVGFVCDVTALRDRLGVTPAIDIEEGARSTADWYRSAGWLKP